MMYSQNDEAGVLEAVQIKIFSLPDHGQQGFTIFKILVTDFTIW